MDERSPQPRPEAGIEPHRLSIEACAAAQTTDIQRGLGAAEARARLERFGPNVLESEPAEPWWRKLASQFRDVLVILLLAATAISALVWWVERTSALPYEAMAILSIVVLNAALGFAQQLQAESAVAALKRMSAATANVVRDGERLTIPGAELVPGDLIRVEEGDAVPADARLVQVVALQTSEASLTGESTPVLKDLAAIDAEVGIGDRLDMVFSGTVATYGRGEAIVTATGMATEMGRIAGLLKGTPKEATPLQKELDRVGKVLGLVVVGIAAAVVATIVLVDHVRGWTGLFDVLVLGVALAVAAVPEGLPAMVTAVLALGVQRMARRHAIVRHLSAVETLGSADVIASDKTGTLTRNEMTVRAVVTASGRVDFGGTGYGPTGTVSVAGGAPLEGAVQDELRRALTVADRSNNAALREEGGHWTIQGDPTEAALVVAARKAGLSGDDLSARFERVAEVPFSSDRKLMSTVHTDTERTDRLLVFTKGAPDVLVSRCATEFVAGVERPLDEARRAELLKTVEGLAGEALRTLGVALRELPRDALDGREADPALEEGLVFLGLVGMIDPPRSEAEGAVERARRAGIRPILITGDHPVTASIIAMELGIATDRHVVSGADLAKLSDTELEAAVAESSVYARISPEQKLRIVKALQKRGSTVAMTGDGVNDAPALRTADIGIAMGIAGTDVSKEAADVILVDDNYATIVAAVEEGRAIYANIRKFLRYLLSSNIGEVMTMFLGIVFAKAIGLVEPGTAVALPLLATQILWTNLVTDGAPALALGVDPPEEGLMDRPPRPHAEGVLTPRMWRGIVGVGLVIAAGTLGVLDASLPGGLIEGTGTLRHAQTMAFTTLVLFQLFNAFNSRSDDRSAFAGLFRNGWLWGATALSLALQVAVVEAPFLQKAFSTTSLDATDWILCTVVASSVLWLRELAKIVHRIRRRSATPAATPSE